MATQPKKKHYYAFFTGVELIPSASQIFNHFKKIEPQETVTKDKVPPSSDQTSSSPNKRNPNK